MLMPKMFRESLFDNLMDPFRGWEDMERKLYGKPASPMMKTDVKEHDGHYEMDIDLPGYQKDEISLALDEGVLTVTATKSQSNDETDSQGKLIRQERYTGTMQRSFYLGEALTEEDVKARFENGVLRLTVPKKEKPALPERKTIFIEG